MDLVWWDIILFSKEHFTHVHIRKVLSGVSDFICDFGKLPFQLHKGKKFKAFGKITTKPYRIEKI